jgi:uncharacterized membrane protein
MAEPGARTHARDDAETEFNRIVAFTDGVFAIAITLLVLTLEIPAGGDLDHELSERGEEFFAYFLSFAVLARFWLAHHRFYGTVERFDGRLIALNLFYLSFITLLPFTTELLGNYSDDSLGVAIYAANLTVISAAFFLQIRHCYRGGLMQADAAEYEERFAGPANWLVAIVFGTSIPVAFLSPTGATLMWLSVFFLGRIVGDRIAGKRAPT